MLTVRGANPTLYARKKLSGLFEKFPKVQLEKKRGGIPAQDAEHQNYLILDHYSHRIRRTSAARVCCETYLCRCGPVLLLQLLLLLLLLLRY